MARPLRLEFPGAVYHLTSRGNARQKIFFTDADRELFLSTLSGVVRRYHWICHAYCLMANHYHLLIETPKANLSIGMRQLNGIYTQSFNRRHHRVGHLFQGRFKAIVVEKEAHLLELCRYVVLNPVRVKGGASARSWKWSSYRATAGRSSVPRVFEHRLDFRAVWQDPVTSAAALSGIYPRRNGEPAVGRSQGTDLFRQPSIH
jgi:REP element-mobilizing transposase RayT